MSDERLDSYLSLDWGVKLRVEGRISRTQLLLRREMMRGIFMVLKASSSILAVWRWDEIDISEEDERDICGRIV